MDAAVWLTGTQGAVMMAMDAPEAFGQLIDMIAETDYARTELAAATPTAWTWSASAAGIRRPISGRRRLFDRYVYPHLAELTALAHRHGKKFAYVMTTGVERLGPRLADAGVDVLYFVDPILDRIPLEKAKQLVRRPDDDGRRHQRLEPGLRRPAADPRRGAAGDRSPRPDEPLHPPPRGRHLPGYALGGRREQMIEAWKECR